LIRVNTSQGMVLLAAKNNGQIQVIKVNKK
jgi:hypothetical protein